MRFHHVGLVIPSHEAAGDIARRLGGHVVVWQRVTAFACTCAFLICHPQIELVVPDAGSTLAKYPESSPTALHHLAFALERHELPPEPLIFPDWADGACGLRVNFGAPRNGLFTEYVIEPSR